MAKNGKQSKTSRPAPPVITGVKSVRNISSHTTAISFAVASPARTKHKTERVAYHEAAHAVAAYWHKLGLRSASIVEDEDTEGRVLTNTLPKSMFRNGELDARTPAAVKRIENEILCDLAGLAAERRHFNRRKWRGGRGDTARAVRLADATHGSERQVDAYLKYMMICAEDFVALPFIWPAVEAVAKALLSRHALRKSEVREIIQKALESPL